MFYHYTFYHLNILKILFYQIKIRWMKADLIHLIDRLHTLHYFHNQEVIMVRQILFFSLNDQYNKSNLKLKPNY
jgi:hypothetical protein